MARGKYLSLEEARCSGKISRFDECGYPCKLALDYDLSEGRFKVADYKMPYEA